jgi:hypothetical protein
MDRLTALSGAFYLILLGLLEEKEGFESDF